MKKTIFLGIGVALAMCACSGNAEKANTESNNEAVNPDPVAETVVTDTIDTEGYTTTATGLKYKVIKEGEGAKPTATDAVTVHYTGKHMNGQVFDSSVQRGEPATFPLNQVIKGWTEGVQLMSPGAKYQFIIPSDLAYGVQGTPDGSIRPDETLYFEVELISVGK